MIWTAIILLAVLACGWATVQWADLREAEIEARYPPIGEMVRVGDRTVHVVVEGEGPDLVLIHGAGGNARDFTFRFTDQLKDRFRVFSVDRPGLGWSDRGRDGLNSAFTADAESAAEQASLIAAAVHKLGADKPLVLGHSYGGAVAMAWALEEPAAGIVLLSGATMPWPGGLDPYYKIFGSPLGSALGAPLVSAFVPRARVEQAVKGVFTPAPVTEGYFTGAAIPLATRIDTFRANARQVRNLFPQVVEMSKRYPGVTLPVEVLHGTADTTVWASIHAEPITALLPNANLTLIEGVGHAPHHVAPEPVIAAIDRLAERAGLR
ncbi:MAG: alpha/beta hydrolase [Pseudomonadota bacterium]